MSKSNKELAVELTVAFIEQTSKDKYANTGRLAAPLDAEAIVKFLKFFHSELTKLDDH